MTRILSGKTQTGLPGGYGNGGSMAKAGGRVSKDVSPKRGVKRLIAKDPSKGTSANIGTEKDVPLLGRIKEDALAFIGWAFQNDDDDFVAGLTFKYKNRPDDEVSDGTVLFAMLTGQDETQVSDEVTLFEASWSDVGGDDDPGYDDDVPCLILNPIVVGAQASHTFAAAAGNHFDIVAQEFGTDGNDISVEIINPGENGAASIEVDDSLVTITLAYAGGVTTTTINQLADLFGTNEDVSALIGLGNITDSTAKVSAVAETSLAGGVDIEMTVPSVQDVIDAWGNPDDDTPGSPEMNARDDFELVVDDDTDTDVDFDVNGTDFSQGELFEFNSFFAGGLPQGAVDTVGAQSPTIVKAKGPRNSVPVGQSKPRDRSANKSIKRR